MNAKKTATAIVLVAVSALNAESVWTGAEDSFWTNANNWASGVVPGILDDENRWSEENLADDSGNTAVFSSTSENTTIDIDGLHAVKFMNFSGDIPRFTFGTSSAQTLRFLAGGKITVESTATHAPVFAAVLSPNCGTKSSAAGVLSVLNYSSDTLGINDIGNQTSHPDMATYATHQLQILRAGPVEINGGYVSAATCRNLYFNGQDVLLNGSLEGVFKFYAGGGGRLTIAQGKSVSMLSSLSGSHIYFDNGKYTIDGDGSFKIAPNAGRTLGDFQFAKANSVDAVATVSCLVTEAVKGCGAWVKGEGTLVLVRTDNEITGPFDIWPGTSGARSTVAATKIGDEGETSSLGDPSAVTMAGLATLRYIGEGETTGRTLTIVDHEKSGDGGATLEQAGSGIWTMAAPFAIERTSPTTVTLCGEDTAAPAVYSAVLPDGEESAVSLVKSGTGTWTLTCANSYSGTTTLSGGRLSLATAGRLGTGEIVFAGGELSLEDTLTEKSPDFGQVVLQDGESVLRIGEGIAVTFSSFTRTAGTFDIVLGKGSSFKCVDAADTAPEWLTVNGQAARFSADGTLEFYGYSDEESIDVDIGTGGKLFVQKPEHLPSFESVSVESGVLAGSADFWSATPALEFLSLASFGTNGYWGAEIWPEDEWSLSLSALAKTGCGVAVTGGGTFSVEGSADMSPVRVAAYDGTLKLAGPGPVSVSGGSVGAFEGSTAELRVDGASVVRTGEQPLYVGEKLHDGTLAEGRMTVTNGSFTLADMSGCDRAAHFARAIAVGAYGRGVLDVQSGGAVTGRVVASGGTYGKTGAVWVRKEGSLVLRAGDDGLNYGFGAEEKNASGYLGIFGGHARIWGNMRFSRWGTSVVQLEAGGILAIRGAEGGSGDKCTFAHGGNAQLYLHDATFDAGDSDIVIANETGNAAVTVDGPGALLSCQVNSISLTRISAYSGSGTLNVNNGGTVSSQSITPASQYVSAEHNANVISRVNFDGGILDVSGQYAAVFGKEFPAAEEDRVGKVPPPEVRVYGGGMTVKTVYKGVAVKCPIMQATGKGVVSIPLDEPISGLAGAPYVTISGDGEGATAFAQFDPVSGSVTNIVVTSRGWNYVSGATASLEYENGTIASLPCTLGENAAGDLILDGGEEGEIRLGAVNTYGGATVLKGGTLYVDKEGAVPETSTVVFRGGKISIAEGVTAPLTYGADFADAAEGGAVYPGDFNFPEGSTLTVCGLDTAALETAGNRIRLLRFEGTVTGNPAIVMPEIPGWNTDWRDGVLRLVRLRGTTVIVR